MAGRSARGPKARSLERGDLTPPTMANVAFAKAAPSFALASGRQIQGDTGHFAATKRPFALLHHYGRPAWLSIETAGLCHRNRARAPRPLESGRTSRRRCRMPMRHRLRPEGARRTAGDRTTVARFEAGSAFGPPSRTDPQPPSAAAAVARSNLRRRRRPSGRACVFLTIRALLLPTVRRLDDSFAAGTQRRHAPWTCGPRRYCSSVTCSIQVVLLPSSASATATWVSALVGVAPRANAWLPTGSGRRHPAGSPALGRPPAAPSRSRR
jgi:hypothetical protein